MSIALLLLALSSQPLLEDTPQATAPVSAQESAPVQLANEEAPHGVLRYRILGAGEKPMPCRLTFIPSDGGALEIFPNTQAAPADLAVRENMVYSLSGVGAITVPVGSYTVYATRGMEWSLAAELVSIDSDDEQLFSAPLVREVPTLGWISGDYHLHTLTYSGHGDSNLDERVISLIGEGVEFAVATDHNHNTDYNPTVERLGAGREVKAVVGNEVSTPIGHLNAFPLDPERPIADPEAMDAQTLFRFLHAEPNPFGVSPVIQLNHPRWGGIDYFTKTGLDPLTGTSDSPRYSGEFDTIEVLNSNQSWGYHDADTSELPVGEGIHSVLQDWYNLLNRGQRCYAVGNSDSHTVKLMTAGYPRNFVRSQAQNPADIDVAEVVENLRAGQVFTTTGPFVEFKVNGAEMGETIVAEEGRVLVFVRVRTPQWVYVNRVKFIVNGDLWRTVELDPQVREDGTIVWPMLQEVFKLEQDSWLHVIVEGDEPLEPLVSPHERPILPLAVTNPVWVHVSDSPDWIAPWDYALMDSGRRASLEGLRAGSAALLTLAAVERERPHALRLVQEALGSRERWVQLAGMRASERLAGPTLVAPLGSLFAAAQDPFFALTAARALAVCDPAGAPARLEALNQRFGEERLRRYPVELERLRSPR